MSTAAAWEIARVTTDSVYPVFAPLAAMLTVQATVVESLRTGIQRTIGVVAGVLLAFLLASALGVHWWSVGLLVFLGLLIGQSLAIGSSGSTQIAVSALLVLVLAGGSNRYAVDRILDTLIGAAVGMIVSLLLVPPLHVRDAGVAVRHFAGSLAAVLTATAESLRGGWPGTATEKCLEQSRALKRELVLTRQEVDRGEDSIRYNVRSRGNEQIVTLHRRVLTTLAHAEIMTGGITRTLADEAAALRQEAARGEDPPPPLPDDLRGQLVAVLIGAANTLREAGRLVVDDGETGATGEIQKAIHETAAQDRRRRPRARPGRPGTRAPSAPVARPRQRDHRSATPARRARRARATAGLHAALAPAGRCAVS